MEMFLSDLKEVSKKENENTKEILLKLDKESAGMKDNKVFYIY